MKLPGFTKVSGLFADSETIPLTWSISNCLLKQKPKNGNKCFTDVHFYTSKIMNKYKNILYISFNITESHQVTVRLDFANKTITYSEGHSCFPVRSILKEIKAIILQLQVLFHL